ncbi:MAG: 23S rRNA (uracil(1939)-C(5))-methyltransferase RlmD [Alphaproteobacteria bacterium ADurb.Bin438]|nr:MAG: 23S rRNA (uracil(1939)-C(5))-methyltransferase RlmD [Alphaproteobacteria bacterium ADurb.Bin438]
MFKNPLTAKELDSFDVIVMDPPRTGATAISQNFKNTKKINQIVYISCNPSTFVRDAKYITEAGFKIVEIDVVDQFTYTHHLELIANIVRA